MRRDGRYVEVLTERDSFVSGHWILNGFVIEGKHAVERIHEDWNLVQDSFKLVLASRERDGELGLP